MVLLAAGAIFLFGLLAIGVDGGMLFVDRRQLQNVADAGALAGAYALESLPLPTYSPAHQKALQIMVDNLPGTTMPGTIPTTASFTQSLGANYSVTVNATGGTGWDQYQVTINHTDQLQLVKILGFGNVTLSAMATARSGTYPFAMILLQNQFSYDDFTTTGNGKVTILKASTATAGGGGFSNESWNLGSNGSLYFGSPPPGTGCGTSGDIWAAAEISTETATLDTKIYGAQAINDTTCTAHPLPTMPYPEVSGQLPFPSYPEPLPTGNNYTSGTISASTNIYLCPGTYSSLSVTGGVTIMTPGVYRFTGSISLSGGGTIRSAVAGDYSASSPYSILPAAGTGYNCTGTPSNPPTNTDLGIIIEITPSGCNTLQFNVSGNNSSLIDISPSPKYNQISLYVELYSANWKTLCPPTAPTTPAGTHIVDISGSGNYSIRGALYGPADNMMLSGNGGGYGVGQLIAWTAQAQGNGNVKENYDPKYLPYFRGLIQ